MKSCFKEDVLKAKASNPEYQIRFLAYVVHKGGFAFAGNVLERKHAFVNWIADRKAQYKIAHPGYIIGGDTIANQDHFTDFILSGEWL